MAVQRFVVIQAGKLSVERWLNQIEKGRRNCYFFYACKRGWMKLTRLEIYNKKDINLGHLIQEKTFHTPRLLVHGPGIVKTILYWVLLKWCILRAMSS